MPRNKAVAVAPLGRQAAWVRNRRPSRGRLRASLAAWGMGMCSWLFLLACAPPSSSTRVVRLEIHAYYHCGACPPIARSANLLITCEPRRCVTVGGEVPVELVEAFRVAVIPLVMDHIDLENLGVSGEWVRRLAAQEHARLDGENPGKGSFRDEFGTRLDDCAPRTDVLHALLTSYYSPKYYWSDDYPGVNALMTLLSSAKVELSSSSQKEFMLPWRITTRAKSRVTYDARISRALAALLPRDFLERQRIAGEGLGEWYLRQFRNKFPPVCGW